ncbi:MAG: phospholipase D-like domain-containing protein [Candidatus Marinimicrobia bacterium]|nr:phospholipase D-like domain-containing protein [Candidatus Neomarinimicrobiota bacterium]
MIELVESIPIETTLDNEDIRNTSEVWIEMISSARHSLDFGEFYISHKKGEALEPVLNAVLAAAGRGVKIRFIVDGNMYKTYPETADKLNEHPNINVQVYKLSEITGGVLHAKYFIVDEKEIFIGSQNFDWRALKHIHELGIRIENKKLVLFYMELFELDWQLSAEDANSELILSNITHRDVLESFVVKKSKYEKINLTPTASNPKIIYNTANWDESNLVRLIGSAEKSIRIQLLSYSPLSRKELYETLDLALRKAAARGVKVEMILSDWNFYSPRIEYIKSLHAIPNIEIKFSTIPEASEGYIGYARVEHCKFMVVDDKEFWLGTSNWSKGYFHKGRNLGIIVQNEKLATRVSGIFKKSWESGYCHLVDLGKEYERKETRE